MKLQSKVLLIMAATWLIICAVIYADYRLIITGNYQQLEDELIGHDIQDTQRAYDKMLDSLALYAKAFSQWDESYEFMQQKSQKFIDSNFVPGNFTTSNTDFLLYYDLDGKYYYGGAYKQDTDTVVAAPYQLTGYLEANPTFLHHDANSNSRVGIISIPNGLILMTSQPVLTSDGKGASRGTMLMGYYLSDKQFVNLSDVVGMKLQFFPISAIESDQLLNIQYNKLLSSNDYSSVYVTPKLAHGYLLLRDINHLPVGLLQIDIPRIVYQQGVATSHHYLTVMILSGMVILLLTWYLLKVFVLGRVLSIKNQVSQVDHGNHDYRPVVLSGDDELNMMVTSINHMMTMIMNTQTDLRHMANYDGLTQLPNRNHFSELLSQVIKRAHQNSENVAVLFIDMDKLKFVNDKYGHAMGDKLIQYVVNRIKHVIKSTDIMARQSGDEFLLFIDHVYDLRSVKATARRILDTTAIPFTIDGIEILTTFSVGVSVYPDNGITVEELIKNADTAMYRVKTTGGNNFDFYHAELDHVN